MSLAWKVTVTVVLFAICCGRGRRPHRQPPRHAAHRRLHLARRPGQPVNVTLQTVGTFGSGSHPTWVSYLVQSPQGQWVHTTVFQVPAAHPHQRHDLPVRLGQPAAQPAARPGHGHVRQRRHPQRQAVPGHQLQRRQRRGAHLLHPLARHQRAALRQQRRTPTSAARRPARTKLAAQGHQVLLHQPRARATTAGSASSPAGSASSSATAGPMSTLGYMGGFMKVVA